MPRLIYAHGVQGNVENGGLVVTAQYDTGEVMSYAKVSISAPDAKLSFQSGRTDRNGRFCFFPDVPGEWKVVVDDEIGHRLELAVSVRDDLGATDTDEAAVAKGSASRWQGVITGVSIIFGLFGILFLWKRRKIVVPE